MHHVQSQVSSDNRYNLCIFYQLRFPVISKNNLSNKGLNIHSENLLNVLQTPHWHILKHCRFYWSDKIPYYNIRIYMLAISVATPIYVIGFEKTRLNGIFHISRNTILKYSSHSGSLMLNCVETSDSQHN